MSKVLDKAFLESVFPPERTEAFFDALFGGAEEGAYDIVLVCRSEGEGRRNWPLSCISVPENVFACNLTYGLPQVFQRHPILNVAGVARAVAEKLGWPGDKVRWWLGHTEEVSRSLHVIPLYLERTAD